MTGILGIACILFGGLGVLVGLILLIAKEKRASKILLIGGGIILLIGFSICSQFKIG